MHVLFQGLRIFLAALALSGAAAPHPAWADWVELGEDSSYRFYVDPDTLRGDLVRRTASALFNALSPDQRVQSMRMLLDIDCREARLRIAARTVHGQPMAAGPELALPLARSSTWDYVRPGTANEAIRRYVCAASEAEMVAALDRSGPSGRAASDRRPAAQAATMSGPVAVPLQRQGGTFTVPVLINDQVTLRFVVDSGAADVNIPTDVVSNLISSGALSKTDFLGRRNYVLADGSRISAETLRIRSMRIGGRVVEDVTGTVGSASSPFLLGQSFLRRLKSWSIDNANDALILE
ncbi:MAG: clan AA aspartic protease [Proteobacteria bacterium]|nr:clan AA aspartic protease [Burkholderiales bacterium]